MQDTEQAASVITQLLKQTSWVTDLPDLQLQLVMACVSILFTWRLEDMTQPDHPGHTAVQVCFQSVVCCVMMSVASLDRVACSTVMVSDNVLLPTTHKLDQLCSTSAQNNCCVFGRSLIGDLLCGSGAVLGACPITRAVSHKGAAVLLSFCIAATGVEQSFGGRVSHLH